MIQRHKHEAAKRVTYLTLTAVKKSDLDLMLIDPVKQPVKCMVVFRLLNILIRSLERKDIEYLKKHRVMINGCISLLNHLRFSVLMIFGAFCSLETNQKRLPASVSNLFILPLQTQSLNFC